ncbi:MAG: divalent-cation tolerance protein CutA [Candidatus Hydrothermarchaeaceae archaeon]
MYAIVYITASNIGEARDLVEAIVKERLAACANVVESVESTYWWQGKIERDDESLIILKTKESKLDELIKRVKELHSYENPEIVAVPILKGSSDYLRWIDEELEKS